MESEPFYSGFSTTTLNFQRIAYLLSPILEVSYPALIILVFYNLIMPIPVKKKVE